MRAQVAAAAARVHVDPFVPKAGVRIETDPKATTVSKAIAMGDDEGAISALIARLEVRAHVLAFVPLVVTGVVGRERLLSQGRQQLPCGDAPVEALLAPGACIMIWPAWHAATHCCKRRYDSICSDGSCFVLGSVWT